MKQDEIYRLAEGIKRSYPYYPSTFSRCPRCISRLGRGGEYCAYCLEDDLGKLVGPDKAHSFHLAVVHLSELEHDMMDSVKEAE